MELTETDRKRIYEEEKARLEARGELNRPKWGKCLFVAVLIFFGLIVFFHSIGDNQKTRAERPRLTADQTALIESWVRDGTLEINPSLHKAYFNPALWAAFTAKNKERLGALVATYCAEQSNGQAWAEIYDAQSGKRLAKYSGAWGFTVD